LERIAIVSEDISAPVDEGFKKATVKLAAAIKDLIAETVVFTQAPSDAPIEARVLPGNKLLWNGSFGRGLKALDPDMILYVPQAAATPMSFARAAALRRQSGGKPVVMLSLQRRIYPAFLIPLIKLLAPDLILVLSTAGSELVRGIGCKVRRVPLGVDSDVFRPPEPGAKHELRGKYGLPEGPIILHVGHISPGRNLEVLRRIADDGRRVLVVSSTTTRRHAEVEAMLHMPNVRLMDRYIEHIEEIYKLVDGYLFPTLSATDAIDIPLSVLEAMATNLPVVTTAFGGLPDLFTSGDGLFICFTEDEVVRAAGEMLRTGTTATRDKVLGLSWSKAAADILEAMRAELS
jgi:glycosyltransferase involved in cell wall biosynthesis